MTNFRFPPMEPVSVLQQVQAGIPVVESWIHQIRPSSSLIVQPLCIGLLDYGADVTHPAFSGASIVTRSFIGGKDAHDETGEGNHHLGLLVAQPETGNGGLCEDAIVFAAKVYTPQQTFEQLEDAMYKALLWLGKVECPLVLLPQGSIRNSALVRQALHTLMEQGALVLAGAGDIRDDMPLFPAAMRGVIAVSALDRQGQPLAGVYQGDDVDLLAPGDSLISAGRQDWEQRSGTGVATVIAGGLLARSLTNKPLRITPAAVD